MGIKKGNKYEESSFVTFSEDTKNAETSSPIEEIPIKEFAKAPPKVPKFIHPLPNRADLKLGTPTKKEKEGGSFFSLNENIMSQNNSDNINNNSNLITIPRSKSFGNDIADAIPFIDSTEENGNLEESFDNAAFLLKNENTALITNDDIDVNLNNKNLTESFSAPNTPSRSEKYAQTDDSSESPDKRTPKRRFPRLGTFDRIKVEKKVTLDPNSTTIASSPIHTRTGTSFRHRRHIKTTVSKEQLLKATTISPSKEYEEEEKAICVTPSESPVTDKKKDKRGIFARLFKRESKSLDHTYQRQDVPMANLDETQNTEHPPDSESSVTPKRASWVS